MLYNLTHLIKIKLKNVVIELKDKPFSMIINNIKEDLQSRKMTIRKQQRDKEKIVSHMVFDRMELERTIEYKMICYLRYKFIAINSKCFELFISIKQIIFLSFFRFMIPK